MDPLARRMFKLVEPICLVNFFCDEPNDAMAAIGFPRYWDGYFAGRAAPLGLVPPEVVDAVFYNFGPGEVARHIPKVWATATPEQSHAARQAGCVTSLHRILDGTPGIAEAADLLAKAGASAPLIGRPLYAALRSLPIPADPMERLWHAATLLREHRGDGHNAVLVTEGISGLEAHMLAALEMPMPAKEFGRIWHLDPALLDEVFEGLQARGIVGADGWFTDEGKSLKARIEATTDELASVPYDALSPGELADLITHLEPIAAALAAAGIPVP